MDSLNVRKRFVRKIFTILSLQFAFMITIVWPFVYLQEFQLFLTTEYWIHWFIFFGSLLIIVTIAFSIPNYPRKFPYSFILLQALVTSIAVVMGTFSMFLNVSIIYIGFVQTFVLLLVLMVVAYFHSEDITTYKNIILLSCLMGLIAFVCSIISLFLLEEIISNLLSVVISTIFVVVMCSYFLYDTRIILNGKRCNITYDDHVIAVVHILLDVGFLVMFLIRGKDEPIFGLVT